jgi:YYY domain-containing protein
MAPSDIQAVLQWWLTILILGIAFLPLTFSLFKNFFDRGYIFSKVLGLSILSYIIFLLGIIHLLSLTQLYLFLLLSIISVTLFLLTLKKLDLVKIFKQYYLIFIFEELLFLGALFFWSYIHSFNPDIHGLEKYMDYGFINSILRADYFPPKDMWFTPLPINYYYFGHLATAILTKLSGIPSNITFNLMLSTIFALCLTQTFSIGANLYNLMQNNIAVSRLKRIIAGILTALLVTASGNLHILYAFFKPYENDKPLPLPFLDFGIKLKVPKLEFNPFEFPNLYWYPNATRFIHNTIHEFPIYSWVVADLHGHVLDIPFVLLTIALLLSFFTTSSGTLRTEKPHKSLPNKSRVNSLIATWKSSLSQQSIGLGNLILIGFLLAIMYMTNAWDGGIYLLLAGLVLLFINNLQLKIFIQSMTIVTLSLFLFSFPYNYFFKPFASGIGILCSRKDRTTTF